MTGARKNLQIVSGFCPSLASMLELQPDNHPSNVSSFKNWLQHFNQDSDQLFTQYEFRKIYLFYDAVHLMKNIRNYLLNNKRFFIFPPFKPDGLKEPIRVRERCFFRRQLEKSSKASNKGTTPRMQTKCFGSTRNTS